jgi:putative toxin-antitoxin system antitoxin component (TIGR02293 family)
MPYGKQIMANGTKMAERNVQEIKALAHKLRSSLGVEDERLIDVRKVLSKLTDIFPDIGVEVVPDSKASRLAWVDSQKLFVKRSVVDSPVLDSYVRFVLAHQLGHLVLHHGGRSSRKSRNSPRLGPEKEEREAAIFASEFLMPATVLPFHTAAHTAAEIQKNFRLGAAPLKRFVELKSVDKLPIAPAARARPNIVNELADHGYSEEELSELVVPKRTLARRRSDDELLTIEETDKALRLSRIAMLAEQIFADRAKAHRWLRKPKRQLQGEAPLAYLASENGARIVEEMLRRIEHGIFA